MQQGLSAAASNIRSRARWPPTSAEQRDRQASGAFAYLWNTGSTNSAITIAPGVTTTYSVVATNTLGCSLTFAYTQVVDPCTGITNSGTIDNSIRVFPNPSTSLINVKFEFDGIKHTQIFNQIGQSVATRSSELMNEEFDLSGFAKGIYYVKITGKTTSGNFKIVVE